MAERRSVLVTGASRGLGRALVSAFARRGRQVFAVVREETRRAALLREVEGEVWPIVADVTQSDLRERIREAVGPRGGVVDILVNNAGSRGFLCSLEEPVEDEVSSLLAVHCVGALRSARAALPFLRASPRPLIVNLTSRFGSITRTAGGEFEGPHLSYSYRIAKAAQNMLTLCLHQELRSQGIGVCAVHPGLLRTDSGPAEATTSAEEGADRLASWALSPEPVASGRYYDLDSGPSDW